MRGHRRARLWIQLASLDPLELIGYPFKIPEPHQLRLLWSARREKVIMSTSVLNGVGEEMYSFLYLSRFSAGSL